MVIADYLLSNGLRACGVIVKYTNLSVFNHVIRQEEDVGCPPDSRFFAVKYDYEWLRKFFYVSYMATCKTRWQGRI